MKNKYLWYKKRDDLQSADTIHQILVYGTLKDIFSLKSQISEDRIQKIFIENPKNIYTKADFNFVKNYLLRIDGEVDEADYLKTSARNIKSRATTTS